MLKRTKLKFIARTRLTEARILFYRKKYDGAVYLCGYAIELALKRKIAEVLDWRGYPETEQEFSGLNSFKIHKLGLLLKLSGLERQWQKKSRLFAKWQIVQRWDPEIRYREIGRLSKSDAKETIDASEKILKELGL